MKKKHLRKKTNRILNQAKDTLDFLYRTSFHIEPGYSTIYELAVQTIYLKTGLTCMIKKFQEKGNFPDIYYEPYSLPVTMETDYDDDTLINMVYDDSFVWETFELLTGFGWECFSIPNLSPETKTSISERFMLYPKEPCFLDETATVFEEDFGGGVFFRMYNRRLEALEKYLFHHPMYRSHTLVKTILYLSPLVGIPFLWYSDDCTARFARNSYPDKEDTPLYSCFYSFSGFDPYYEIDVHACYLNPLAMQFAEWLNELLNLAEQVFQYETSVKSQ